MIFNSPILSICIPSYNRPKQLAELLQTIDCNISDIEVVICEDLAPKRVEVRAVIEDFINSSDLSVHYFENEYNLGFDGNIRRLVECAHGEYVMFMGDDDLFVGDALDNFIAFIKINRDKKYILRTYLTMHDDGQTEYFRYLPSSKALNHGEATVAWLFKRSVSLCGFTISREEALKHSTTDLDGTLLYQVYLMSQVCLQYDAIYCDIPITHAVQSFKLDQPMFGVSEAEKSRFTPGTVSHDNSINFTKAYFEVSGYLDKQHGTELTKRIRTDLSKYSYPFLSIQRKRGIRSFLAYAKRLEVEVGMGCTSYYYLYKWALILLGEKICDRLILRIKQIVGHTPNF
ncbi:MAG: glycosyltransferase family 2 protein [Gammaproteobacteria bacterium]|jgi:abequosyltransferase|nr:glycosyltransferase family 2 protein [Gammaproteobacteria bacterium]MBT4146372.1 glycosyltransferase family 2 protein [Gammaproteobacteria bacterium]